MVLALGGAGLYFGKLTLPPGECPVQPHAPSTSYHSHNLSGRSPTSSTSESPVHIAQGGMPWDSDTLGKYKYHPGGDLSKAPRDAPSALNSVVIPNVTVPKEMHDQFNKWGKEGYP